MKKIFFMFLICATVLLSGCNSEKDHILVYQKENIPYVVVEGVSHTYIAKRPDGWYVERWASTLDNAIYYSTKVPE